MQQLFIVFSNIVRLKKISCYEVSKTENIEKVDLNTTVSIFDFRLIRDNYRQLKYACSKQGDYIGEQYFHGLEINAYNDSLSYKKNFWTKIIFKLSYLTSNYGQSFLLPIPWIIGLNSFFILVIILKWGDKV